MHIVLTFIDELNPTYYASIMLDAFNNLLCSKLCWYNRPGPNTNRVNVLELV